jgi:hypothetical protein
MDPLSISAAAVGLTANVTKLIYRVITFCGEVRGARKDMDAVARELISLQLSLKTLRDDEQRSVVPYPDKVRQHLKDLILNCDIVTQQINEVLRRLLSGRLGRRIQWAFTKKEEVDKLRSSLESNKTALDSMLSVTRGKFCGRWQSF